MSTITYEGGLAANAATAPRVTVRAKGFWGRVFDRLVEARMKQAIAEARRYGVVIPRELEQSALSSAAQDKNGLPFTR
ncbi:MAG: hypothetical protein FJX62_12200 [Alphaproteobacteria bacterium]|nr:hypothetical protein [Alphaproteobacteria bacterium]